MSHFWSEWSAHISDTTTKTQIKSEKWLFCLFKSKWIVIESKCMEKASKRTYGRRKRHIFFVRSRSWAIGDLGTAREMKGEIKRETTKKMEEKWRREKESNTNWKNERKYDGISVWCDKSLIWTAYLAPYCVHFTQKSSPNRKVRTIFSGMKRDTLYKCVWWGKKNAN